MSEYGDAIASLVAAVRDIDKAATISNKVRVERDEAQATIARMTALADQWDNDADSADETATHRDIERAHAYATDLRSAIETSTTATETTT